LQQLANCDCSLYTATVVLELYHCSC
jgi:hypothetical protein